MNGPATTSEVEERDRLPGEHVLDVVEAAAADRRRLDLLGREGDVDGRGGGFGARAPQRLAEAGQLQSGRVQPGLEHGAVLVREGRALQLRQDLRDLRWVCSIWVWRVSACSCRSSIP